MSDTSRLLVLVRHGKAQSGEQSSDHDRRLTSRGRSDAAAAGRRIGQLLGGRPVDLVWVSSALRAHQTWEQVAVSLPPVGQVVVERDLYVAGGREVLDRLESALSDKGAGETQVMVVVGHNPTMEQVVRALLGELHPMRPGTAVVIALDADATSPLTGSLVDLISPRG